MKNRFFALFLKVLAITAAVSIIQMLGLMCLGYNVAGKIEKKLKRPEVHEGQLEMTNYPAKLRDLGVFDNAPEEALPQTVVYKLVTDHFSAPLPDGKTVKKAMILGYDGFRADAIEYVMAEEESAIMRIKNRGGKLYHAFTGGIPGENEQPTFTGPGFLTVLSGGWADYHGVYDNSYTKNDCGTLLTELPRQGTRTFFASAFKGLFNILCRPDFVLAVKERLPLRFQATEGDFESYALTVQQLLQPNAENQASEEDMDAFIVILHPPDEAGENYGFYPNPDYMAGCKFADSMGYDILKAIESRETYAQEDWLTVIVTDHGGCEKSHGNQSVFERSIWIAVNQSVPMTEEYLNYARK